LSESFVPSKGKFSGLKSEYADSAPGNIRKTASSHSEEEEKGPAKKKCDLNIDSLIFLLLLLLDCIDSF